MYSAAVVDLALEIPLQNVKSLNFELLHYRLLNPSVLERESMCAFECASTEKEREKERGRERGGGRKRERETEARRELMTKNKHQSIINI